MLKLLLSSLRLAACSRVSVGLLMFFATCQVAFAQQDAGPPSPTSEGTSPLIGYLLAVVLLVLLVVVSIIPSKRHFEDI